MIPAQAYTELITRVKEASLLGSCAGVLGWDERTYMPKNASEFRGEQMGLLARMSHEMFTSPRIGELLAHVEGTPVVIDPESAHAVNVREIRRGYNRQIKLPKELVEELARVTIRAQGAWQEARAKNDFPAFQPWLEKIVALKREESQAVGYEKHPYDALLDEYEPGASAEQISRVFAEFRRDLVPLIAAIAQSSRKPNSEILHREYDVEKQKAFVREAASAIGFDFDGGRLDITTHPFCSGIGPGDCRITTRFNPKFFNESFFGTLHEAGHGIYEQNLNASHYGTPAGSACSLGIHESQSRLWENQVGRGRPFWQHFFPKAQAVFPESLKDTSFDDWYFAINEVKPSFIRVEADEATYNLHIILRFELEQALLTGDLSPGDVPGAWDEKFEQSFGLKVPDAAQGCLQDIHWSMGGIGYFPTYTLGNLYAAQFMDQAKSDLHGLEDDFRHGEFGRLKTWLNEKIHLLGQTYRPEVLCQRITGKPLTHQPLMAYLRAKYGEVYAV